jgi:hypothetical protein
MQMRPKEMTLRVPFVAEESMDRDANTLLAEFARARRVEIRAPIPIEDIVEKHLKLRIEFDDLHGLLGVQRGTQAEIFGAIWLETGEIVIDESLDPEENPSIEGRYRFTLAHEGGALAIAPATCTSKCLRWIIYRPRTTVKHHLSSKPIKGTC